jgi:hypothetical protein
METQMRNEQARSAANTRSLVDGSVVSSDSGKWCFGSVEVMPGDSIVIPENLDKETSWTKFSGCRFSPTSAWAAAAIKKLSN